MIDGESEIVNSLSLDGKSAAIVSFLAGILYILYGFFSFRGLFYVAPHYCNPDWSPLRVDWGDITVEWHAGCDVYGTSGFTVLGVLFLFFACLLGARVARNNVQEHGGQDA